jgi:hypothetical protein
LRYQVGSVSVRTEANQVSGTALRTLDAVTNATCHSTIDRAETSRFSAIQAALKSCCTNIPVAAERILETVDRSVVCTSDTLTGGRHEQFVRGQMMSVEKHADSTIARGGCRGWTFADPAPKDFRPRLLNPSAREPRTRIVADGESDRQSHAKPVLDEFARLVNQRHMTKRSRRKGQHNPVHEEIDQSAEDETRDNRVIDQERKLSAGNVARDHSFCRAQSIGDRLSSPNSNLQFFPSPHARRLNPVHCRRTSSGAMALRESLWLLCLEAPASLSPP